jgi:hypothetical protein
MVPLVAGPGAAQTSSGSARLQLVSQRSWIPLGGDLALQLSVEGAPPGATISLTAHNAVTTRSAYDRTLVGTTALGNVLDQVEVPLDSLASDNTGVRTLVMGLQAPDGGRDLTRLSIRRPGVYPVEVQLRDVTDRALAGFVTPVVVAEAPGQRTVAEPLRVVWVWPLNAAPAYRPDGTPDPRVIADLRPDGRLGQEAAALRRSEDVPLTLVPGPETLEAWLDLARTMPSIAAASDAIPLASPDHQILSNAYVPVDLPSLIDHGFNDVVDEQLIRGDSTLKRLVANPVDTRTALVRPTSPAALARLRTAGVDRVIVDGAALVAAPSRFTPAEPVLLRAPIALAPEENVTALASDPGFEDLLVGEAPPALRAQQILAGLAVVALEQPSLPRAVALVNPDAFDGSVALLDAMLDGLRDDPYLTPVTAAQVFDSIPVSTSNGNPVVRELAPYAAPEPPVPVEVYGSERARLTSFQALTRPGDPQVARADRALLSSISSAWERAAGKARARRLAEVTTEVIDHFLTHIKVPAPNTITLTSRSGEIPLTFRNDTGQPVAIRIALDSDKLFFPDGPVRDLELPPRSSTTRVAVETRTSGSFPLRMHVTSVDGVLGISSRRYEVRSTFVSTVGIVLMAGAVLFLAAWWIWDLRRRRRRARTSATA